MYFEFDDRPTKFEPAIVGKYLNEDVSPLVEMPDSMKHYFAEPSNFVDFMAMLNTIFKVFFNSEAAETLEGFDSKIYANLVEFMTSIYWQFLYDQAQVVENPKADQSIPKKLAA